MATKIWQIGDSFTVKKQASPKELSSVYDPYLHVSRSLWDTWYKTKRVFIIKKIDPFKDYAYIQATDSWHFHSFMIKPILKDKL